MFNSKYTGIIHYLSEKRIYVFLQQWCQNQKNRGIQAFNAGQYSEMSSSASKPKKGMLPFISIQHTLYTVLTDIVSGLAL